MEHNPTQQESNNELHGLQEEMNSATFWDNKDHAQSVIKRIKELHDLQEGVDTIDKGGAIMTLLAGAGGDDSEDFAHQTHS